MEFNNGIGNYRCLLSLEKSAPPPLLEVRFVAATSKRLSTIPLTVRLELTLARIIYLLGKKTIKYRCGGDFTPIGHVARSCDLRTSAVRNPLIYYPSLLLSLEINQPLLSNFT
jgi:hypothetical protein